MADRGGNRAGSLRVVNAFFGSWFGRLVLFGFTWALIHHALGGVRHFIWDTGTGLGTAARDGLAWATSSARSR